MKRKEYEEKLRAWEAEGYDVSELREKWFPLKGRKSRIGIWLSLVVVIFIAVAGVVVWQAMQPAPPSVPAVRIPSPAPTTSPTPAPTPIPAPVAVARYTLATSASPAGAGSVSPGSGTYDTGASVSAVASPAPGYIFDHWSGDFSGTSPTMVLTMDSNKNVVANFVPVYSLSKSINPLMRLFYEMSH